MNRILREIRKLRRSKRIKDDLKTYIQNKLTDETSKEYVQDLIDNVKEESRRIVKRIFRLLDLSGKNTHEIDYDYLGNGTNHLECELKLEMGEKN